ncbi:MAG: WD40 repeat domain-containing protein, partial [Planctomycetota bacterium]
VTGFAPYRNGWIVWSQNRLFQLSADGELMTSYIFELAPETGQPDRPHVIGSNGNSTGRHNDLWRVYLDDSEYRIEPFETASGAPNTNSSSESRVAPLEPVVWADTTRLESVYTAEGHAQILETIHALPSLTLESDGLVPGPAISPFATVKLPQDIRGLQRWTVESVDHSASGLIPNADRTMWATAKNGFVRVYNDKAQLIALLPSPGLTRHVKWDETDPQMLAFSTFPEKQFEPSSPFYQADDVCSVLIWLVDHDGARLIRTFKTSSLEFAIDHSYRIVSFSEGRLTLMRIDDGSSWRVSDSASAGGRFTTVPLGESTPISRDGRFAATLQGGGNQSQTSFWDLQSGTLQLAINDVDAVTWSSDPSLVAAHFWDRESSGRFLEIWNLPGKWKEREFVPPQNDLEQGYSDCEISPDMRKVAFLCPDSTVQLIDTISNGKETVEPESVLGELNSLSVDLEWAGSNELLISDSTRIAIWTGSGEGLSGEFSETLVANEQITKLNSEWLPTYNLRNVTVLDDGRIALTGIIVPNLTNSPECNFFTTILPSLARSNTDSHTTREFSSVSQLPLPSFSARSFFPDHPVISPDGRFTLKLSRLDGGERVQESEQFASRARETLKLLIIDHQISHPDPFEIVGFRKVSDIAWGKDGRFLVVCGEDNDGAVTRVVNLQEWRLEDFEGLTDETVETVIPIDSGFAALVAWDVNNRRQNLLFHLKTDSQAGEAPVASLIDTASLGSSGQNMSLNSFGETLVVTINSTDPLSAPITRNWLIQDGFNLEEVFDGQFNGVISPSGKYALTSTIDNQGARRYQIIESAINETVLQFPPDSYASGFRWHPSNDYAAWEQNDCHCIFAPSTEEVECHTRFDRSSRIIPYNDQSGNAGWLAWDGKQVSYLSLDGTLTRRLAITLDEESGFPEPSPWILGSGGIGDGSLDGLWIAFFGRGKYRLQPMEEFYRGQQGSGFLFDGQDR